MSDLEYSPALGGFVDFGTVATATDTIDPQSGDALFVRETTTFSVPGDLQGATLTIGDDTPGTSKTPLVVVGPGIVLAQDTTIAANGRLQFGPDLASADPNNLAVLVGALTIEAGTTADITAGLLAGPITASGTLDIEGFATIAGPLTFPTTLNLISAPSSLLTYNTDLPTAGLLAILAAPGFAGDLAFGGTLDNTGATLDTSAHSALSFVNATINGGALTLDPGSTLSGTTIVGADLSGTLSTHAGDFNLATGTITGAGTLLVDGSLGLSDATVIDGPAIVLDSDALLFGGGSNDITIAANSTITIADTAALSFNAAGANFQLDGGMDLTDSITPYTVTLVASLGAVVLGADAHLRIGANAALSIDSTVANNGTVELAGGSLEFLRTSNALGTFSFSGSDSKLRLDTLGQSASLIDLADGDELVFPSASKTTPHVVLAGNTLSVISGPTNKLDGTFILARSDGGSYVPGNFTFTTDGTALALTTSGIAITACFAAGTKIETDGGEIPIEALRPGDQVRTFAGSLAPILWIGHRMIDLRGHKRPQDVRPVRVTAHAFGPNLPRRDLVLSPDHAVFAEGALVPIRYLLNGATIIQEQRRRIAYFHLELADHGIIFADGLPAETYLDTGNRGAFANGDGATLLHPDFARHVWHERACAPLVTDGPTVTLLRRALLAQAQSLGHTLTTDAGLGLFRDRDGIHLRSGRFVPAHTDPTNSDHRRLGIAVIRISADGTNIPLDDGRLTNGWYPAEAGLRWTTGNAIIATRATRLKIDTLPTGPVYWATGQAEQRSAGQR